MSTPATEQASLTRLIHDTIRAEQERIAKMPPGLKVWTDEQGVAWQNGMSNASRLAQDVVRHWLVAQELTPGAVSLMVDAAAQAMFEDPLTGPEERYTWAEMVAEDPSRADLWRQDARRVLVFSGALHPRYQNTVAPQAPADPSPSVEEVRTVIESAVWEWLNAKGAPWSPGDATVAAFTGPLEAKIRALYAPRLLDETESAAVRESILAADRVPVVSVITGAPEPQVPSDAQVLAALNAQVREDRRAPDLSYWGDAAVDSMRAALAAAQGVDQ